MKDENEIREMIEKLMDYRKGLSWWDDDKEHVACMIDALLWVVGDRSGKSIDPDDWEEQNEN